MSDEKIFDDSDESTAGARPADDERISKLPDFERDDPAQVGGGVLAEGGTAADTGTGMVAGAGGERDLAADEDRGARDTDPPGRRSGPIQLPPEPGGSQ